MTGTAALLVGSEGRARSTTVPVEDVFVWLDLAADAAYVVCESDLGLRWKQIPRDEGELLASLGARTHVLLRPGAQLSNTLPDHPGGSAVERGEVP
jgi:hypothetical protein